MNNKNVVFLTTLLVLLFFTQNVSAAGVGDVTNIRTNGFINAIGAISDSETGYLPDTHHVHEEFSWSGTTAGFNFSANIGKKSSIAMQFFAAGGHEGGGVNFDWGFITHNMSDSASFSAGRIKYPANLVSEYADVGQAYVWIRPPQEIYSHQEGGASMVLQAMNGANVSFHTDVFDESEIELLLYTGDAEEEHMSHLGMRGMKLSLTSDMSRLLLSYNRSEMGMEPMVELIAPAAGGAVVEVETEMEMDGQIMELMAVGYNLDWKKLLLSTEFVHSQTSNIASLEADAWYVTLGYHLGRFTPHVTYSSLESVSELAQTAVTVGFRYELARNLSFKMELQRTEPEEMNSAYDMEQPINADSAGLFEEMPLDEDGNVMDSVNMLSIAISASF